MATRPKASCPRRSERRWAERPQRLLAFQRITTAITLPSDRQPLSTRCLPRSPCPSRGQGPAWDVCSSLRFSLTRWSHLKLCALQPNSTQRRELGPFDDDAVLVRSEVPGVRAPPAAVRLLPDRGPATPRGRASQHDVDLPATSSGGTESAKQEAKTPASGHQRQACPTGRQSIKRRIVRQSLQSQALLQSPTKCPATLDAPDRSSSGTPAKSGKSSMGLREPVRTLGVRVRLHVPTGEPHAQPSYFQQGVLFGAHAQMV